MVQNALDIPKEAGGMPPRDVVTIVLTADNHLGYSASSRYPQKREELQQRLRYAFQKATDFAVGQGVDLFIQAGDLFDTPSPSERDRSFVAARLAQLKQAGIRAFALGGVRDTPVEMPTSPDEASLAPQISFSRLGALHYFPPTAGESSVQLDPVIVDVRGMQVALCALGVSASQEGDPLAHARVAGQVEDTPIALLVLHAPIEGLTTGSSFLDSRARVSRASIMKQTAFRCILAGYHHEYSRSQVGHLEVIVAGSTQLIDFSAPKQQPGFVFLGLAANGVRWCNHISVESLRMQQLTIHTNELWTEQEEADAASPTERVLEQLKPLCDEETMVQLRLEGEVTRGHYHELDLNALRRYGEEHCFALAIDDSALSLLPEQEAATVETSERLSARKELMTLADEWIAAAVDEQERRALQATKEELLLAIDEGRRKI